MMVSGLHNVCQKGYYVAIISTIVETNNPKAELEPAFELIGHNKETEIFFSVRLFFLYFLKELCF